MCTLTGTVFRRYLHWKYTSMTLTLYILYFSGCVPVNIYSISHEICTRFCCALLCCGYAIVHNEITWSIYPYSSGLLCWHWGNRSIATVPVKLAWWIWENQSMYNHNKAQQSKNRVHISWDILYYGEVHTYNCSTCVFEILCRRFFVDFSQTIQSSCHVCD